MDKNFHTAFLCLGTNLGDRESYLSNAIHRIGSDPKIQILKKGTPLNTAALEVVDQPDFLNQLIQVSTSFSPRELLDFVLGIENEMGRIRTKDKGPRVIDIDILSFGDMKIHEKGLHLPHHSLFTRPFILELLNELGEGSLIQAFGEPSEG
ncbi:2-amino-4-hydroxy-6-hydroxymethyldihydropteridine diphosphokinase [Leptospira sarikeiensis]|uniref:2-amino-4-hydroxy-6-hydroxymethyldihydropteridine pyrophosphokinase n=1 Tax=Leptospira sarikeiensis TaxID=2484943 RepID=A0A4R9K3Z4_9LEPT|nr:2-amino-4-hydroxy-6-hydroxymethyldihydropteridine diphosphokinase [Leptospira sarikeiensis]TGL60809.1 2-amino-4-hydroxy-6-hydroxymethyldihydropteridine diphosphokinase [Leptospira sarikeiensis]